MPVSLIQQNEETDSWPPLRGGCQRQLTGGVSYQQRHTPSTASRSPSLLEGGKGYVAVLCRSGSKQKEK